MTDSDRDSLKLQEGPFTITPAEAMEFDAPPKGARNVTYTGLWFHDGTPGHCPAVIRLGVGEKPVKSGGEMYSWIGMAAQCHLPEGHTGPHSVSRGTQVNHAGFQDADHEFTLEWND